MAEFTTDALNLSTEEEDHHDDDDHHEEGEHEEGGLFEVWSGWNVYISLVICVLVILTALPLNTFNITAIWSKSKHNVNSFLILISSFINYITYLLLVPMAIAGLADIDVITENFCYVHEPITIMTIMLRFYLPALISVCRCDSVLRPGRLLFSFPLTIISLLLILGIVLTIALVPILGLTSSDGGIHSHGCHLWSVRVDTSLWFQLYGIASSLFASIFVMTYCYMRIVLKAKASVDSMAVHSNHGNAEKGKTFLVPDRSGLAPSASNVMQGTSGIETINISSNNSAHRQENKASRQNEKANRKLSMHTRVALISFSLIMIHILFWMPWLTINIILSTNKAHEGEEGEEGAEGEEEVGETGGKLPVELRIVTLVIGYIPAVTDPILYALMQPEIVKAAKKLKNRIFK